MMYLGIAFLFLVGFFGCQLETWHQFIDRNCPGGNTYINNKENNIFIQPQPKVEPDPSIDTSSQSAERPLVFQIMADYPPGQIQPDSIRVDGQLFQPRNFYKIGEHGHVVTKTGYENIDKTFLIPSGAGTHAVTEMMYCKSRPIMFDIKDKKTGNKIVPDRVVIGGRDRKEGDLIKPGDYSLEIVKQKYHSIKEDISIGVGETNFVISREMIGVEEPLKKVELSFEFQNAKTKQIISVDSIALDSQSMKNGSLVNPGSYRLTVTKQGYESLQKQIQIPLQPTFKVKGELNPFEIILSWIVKSDYEDMQGEFDPKTVLLDGNPVEKGCSVLPGAHRIIFREPGYEDFSGSFTINPDKKEHVHRAIMITLPRKVEFSIRHDIDPPEGLKPYQTTITNISTQKSQEVAEEITVKPGAYEISCEQEAYRSTHVQKKIWPGTYPDKVELVLEADARLVNADITFDIPAPSNLEAHVISFIEQGTGIRSVVKPGGKIKPGRYDYFVEKPGYATKSGKKFISIEPGVLPVTVVAELVAESRYLSFGMVFGKDMQNAEKILIDGEVYVYKPYRPGTYKIVATFSKFKTVEKDMTILPGVGIHTEVLKLTPK